MDSDEAYYRHLKGGEQPGAHTYVTAHLILEALGFHGLKSGERWLDIGCGSGYLLLKLLERGWDAVGIEPGGWGQIAARERHLAVVQAFLDENTFAETFDHVSATDVIEHQPDPYELVRLIKHYLAPDGTAFISMPFADSWHGKILREKWSMIAPPTHCQFFTKLSLETFLQNAGFHMVRAVQYNASYPRFIGDFSLGRKAIDALLHFSLGGDQVLLLIKPGDSRPTHAL